MLPFDGFDEQVREQVVMFRRYTYERIQSELDFLLGYFRSTIIESQTLSQTIDKVMEIKEKIKKMEIEEIK